MKIEKIIETYLHLEEDNFHETESNLNPSR